MAEMSNSIALVENRAAENGESFDPNRKAASLNGKRSLETSPQEENAESLGYPGVTGSSADAPPSLKKAKTVVNGLEKSATHMVAKQANTLHNGLDTNGSSDSHNGASCMLPESASASSHSDQMSNGAGLDPSSSVCESGPAADKEHVPPTRQVNQDLTVKKEPGKDSETEPEIITLSDSEDEFQEVLLKATSPNSPHCRRLRLLKLYEDQLRSEETKLILLRKLKRSLSNLDRHHAALSSADSKHSSHDARTQSHSSSSSSQRSSTGGNAPPPLRRGANHTSPSPHHGLANHQSPHHKISSTNQHQMTHSSADRHKQLSSHQSNSQQSSSGGPPPLVNMSKSSHTSTNSTSYGSHQVPQAKKAAVSQQPPQPTKEQKLAAAKLLLRKQLEQALQQVPAPKPPPPEVNFLPSLSSGEFVYLIGMEEVVKQLLSADQRDLKFIFSPFSCVQCGTDFTPVWKRDKPGSKNVICEKCITSNQKRVLKQEHTAKLKAVFSKASQKEQDIERRIASGSPILEMPGLSAVASRHHKSHAPPAAAVAAAAATSAAAAASPSMPQLTPQQTTASASSNSSTAHQQQLQQQILLSQHAEQMRAMLAAQLSLPYSIYGANNKQAADLHRQYLLDMINQNRSSWKT